MKNNRKGFTLAELLVVVAIIAVLVAIAIPVFTAQVEKAKEATDLANLRSAYAEVMVSYLADGDEDASQEVKIQQATEGWVIEKTMVGDVDVSSLSVKDGDTVAVSIDGSGNASFAKK